MHAAPLPEIYTNSNAVDTNTRYDQQSVFTVHVAPHILSVRGSCKLFSWGVIYVATPHSFHTSQEDSLTQDRPCHGCTFVHAHVERLQVKHLNGYAVLTPTVSRQAHVLMWHSPRVVLLQDWPIGVARTGDDLDTESSTASLSLRTQFLGPVSTDDWPPLTPNLVRCVASTSSLMPTTCRRSTHHAW